MFRIALAATLVAFAAPALAAEQVHSPQKISDAMKAGCTVQMIHSPSGKAGLQSANVHCPKARTIETASRDATPRERQAGTD